MKYPTQKSAIDVFTRLGRQRASRMNLILEKSEQVTGFTDIAATFSAMGVDPRAYDWYVSDIQANALTPLLNEADVWVTGDELATALLGKPMQFD